MNLFRSLSHRPFALLWTGQTVSRLGDSLYRIAMAWWVLQKTGSAAAMGTILIFSSVPMLIFLLVGGVFTDRLPRLKVMWVSDLLSGTVVAVVALLSFSGTLEVWHIYIASIIFGLVEAFFFPAYTATVPDITPRELLPSANSLTSLSQRGMSILGPAIGASIIALGGPPFAFGLDALSFFISAACVLPLLRANPAPAQQTPPAQPAENPGAQPVAQGLGSVFTDMREGYLAVIASPWLWITIAIFSLVNAASSGPMSVALPFLVKQTLGAGVETLGLFTSVDSVGFVLGALWLGRYTRIRRRGPLSYGATLLAGLTVACFGLTTSIPVLAVAAFLNGFFMAIFGLIWTNSLQELVPSRLLGRVSSIDALGSFVLLPIGFGIAGWATDLVGAPLVFAIGGGVTALLILLGLMHPAIRGLD
jgi:MFS family permease